MHELIHEALRFTHMGFGFLGLPVFWVPVFAKKGSRLHIRAGWVFVLCAYAVALSAMVSCGWAFLWPDSFTDLPGDETERAEALGFIRFFLGILGWLGVLVVVLLRLGIDAVKTRREPERFNRGSNHAATVLLLTASIALLGLAGWQSYALGFTARNWVAIGLGLMGVYQFFEYRGKIRGAWGTKMGWWYFHVESMIGCGIGFHTAFAVFGLGRLMGDSFSPWVTVAWVSPGVIGVVATKLCVRHYRRKFGEV